LRTNKFKLSEGSSSVLEQLEEDLSPESKESLINFLSKSQIKPRYYSLCNDFKADKVIEICFTLHKFKTSKGEERTGHCSEVLSKCEEVEMSFSKVFCVLKLPVEPVEHIFMICNGTGVAPFISILSHLSNTAK
jgi:sulfite reductase alpha subunit-like flavoprotein